MFFEEDDAPLATPMDAMREYAENVGRDNPDAAWIITPYDVWMENPFYDGPSVPHPDDYPDDYDEYDGEPMGPNDLSDDADALASAGWGTDEDYGYSGDMDFDY
jgi:hypothetical protein